MFLPPYLLFILIYHVVMHKALMSREAFSRDVKVEYFGKGKPSNASHQWARRTKLMDHTKSARRAPLHAFVRCRSLSGIKV